MMSPTKLIQGRIEFEALNTTSDLYSSFSSDQVVAHHAYHCSSEGEWEQVRYEVLTRLLKGEKVEVLYTSPSLEKGIHDFIKNQKLSKDQIRLLRLPLTNTRFDSPFKLWRWVTSPELTMVRYDFFPELLALKYFGKRLNLIWVTTKNLKWWQLFIFNFFETLKPVTHKDELRLKKFFSTKVLSPGEGRIKSIECRIKERKHFLMTKWPSFQYFLDFLQAQPQRLIMGSAWESDLEILPQDPQFYLQHLVLIVPHDIKLNWSEIMKSRQIPAFIITDDTLESELLKMIEQYRYEPKAWVLLKKGLLCELYSFFQVAYVGNGFGYSVHSLLEPFLSGCIVCCGPKVHRSSEADVIHESGQNKLHIYAQPEQIKNDLLISRWWSQ